MLLKTLLIHGIDRDQPKLVVTSLQDDSITRISIKDAGESRFALGEFGGVLVSNERTSVVRVAAAISTPLVVGCLAVFAMGGPATADILEVEPDLFPLETVLNLKFPAVILINETTRGDPDETDVLVRSGFVAGGPAPPTAPEVPMPHRRCRMCLAVGLLRRARPPANWII